MAEEREEEEGPDGRTIRPERPKAPPPTKPLRSGNNPALPPDIRETIRPIPADQRPTLQEALRARAAGEPIGRKPTSETIREALTRNANEEEARLVGASAPPVPPSQTAPESSLFKDVVLGIPGELLALPLVDAGMHAIVSGEHETRGIVAVLLGTTVFVVSGTFHWWKRFVTTGVRARIETVAKWGAPLAVALCFFYLVGPDMYRRATETPHIVPPSSAGDFLSAQAKWLVVKALTLAEDRIGDACAAQIYHYPTPYAERLSADLKEVLDTSRWKTFAALASVELPQGITLRASDEIGIKCAEEFRGSFRNIGPNIPVEKLPSAPSPTDAAYYLHCKGCFEVRIGNEPNGH